MTISIHLSGELASALASAKYMNTLINKPKTGSNLVYPEDFRVACLIRDLSHESILRHFFDQVSICNLLNCRDERHLAYPVEVIHEYASLGGEPMIPKGNNINQRRGVSYFRQILGIFHAAALGPKATKTACLSVIDNWHQSLVPRMVTSEVLVVNRNTSIPLSKDLVILCEIFEVRPEEILQYFINQISLPYAKARIRQATPNPRNPSLLFFLAASAGKTGLYSLNHEIPYPGLFFKFNSELQELYLRLLFNRNVTDRERIYRKLYHAWYKAILSEKRPSKKPNPNIK